MRLTEKDYLQMQLESYNSKASKWSLDRRSPVVGSYDRHNAWEEYETYLFKNIDTTNMIALDYGSGPGRNLVKFAPRFSRIDGVDISPVNKAKAIINCTANNIKNFNYYVCDGKSIPIYDIQYDMVFSVICLQHICAHSIRFSIMKDVYRVLSNDGYFCFQMGYDGGRIERKGKYVPYHKNYYDAKATNGKCDVTISDPKELEEDLLKIGFSQVEHDIRPPVPGDSHLNAIFVRAKK